MLSQEQLVPNQLQLNGAQFSTASTSKTAKSLGARASMTLEIKNINQNHVLSTNAHKIQHVDNYLPNIRNMQTPKFISSNQKQQKLRNSMIQSPTARDIATNQIQQIKA